MDAPSNELENAMNDNKPVITINELMERWGCARKTVLDAIKRGSLKAFKPGDRVWRITMEEVLRFERSNAA